MRRPLAVALAALLAAAPAATAHEGNPNFLSQVDAITPRSDGVTVEVLNRDDRLLLHNTSGQDVVIAGYEGEPYARVLADGTVEVNTDSPAHHLNEDRFADVEVPDGGRRQGRAALGGGLAHRALRVARPPRALDGREHAAAGARRERPDEGPRLARPGHGRRRARRDRRDAVLDAGAGRRRAARADLRRRGRADRALHRRDRAAPAAGGGERAGGGGMVRLLLAAALALAVLGGLAARAEAHATLESTTPARSAALERPPEEVVLRFSEPVEVAFGAVQVFDADGQPGRARRRLPPRRRRVGGGGAAARPACRAAATR